MNSTTSSEPEYRLQPIADADMPFLLRLYGTTREAELALTNWTREEKARFIEMQFGLQHHHYTQCNTDATLR